MRNLSTLVACSLVLVAIGCSSTPQAPGDAEEGMIAAGDSPRPGTTAGEAAERGAAADPANDNPQTNLEPTPAASADAPPPPAPPPGESWCYGPGKGLLFCDGFEAESLAGWAQNARDGSATRITTGTFLGLGAVRSTVTKAGGSGALFGVFGRTFTSGHLYARAYLYIPSGFASAALSVLTLGAGAPTYGNVSVVTWDGAVQATVYPRRINTANRNFTMPRNQWLCVQLDTEISATDGTVRIRVDGTEVVRAAGIDTSQEGGYARVSAGINWTDSSQSAPAEVRVDEVAVDTKDVPCIR